MADKQQATVNLNEVIEALEGGYQHPEAFMRAYGEAVKAGISNARYMGKDNNEYAGDEAVVQVNADCRAIVERAAKASVSIGGSKGGLKVKLVDSGLCSISGAAQKQYKWLQIAHTLRALPAVLTALDDIAAVIKADKHVVKQVAVMDRNDKTVQKTDKHGNDVFDYQLWAGTYLVATKNSEANALSCVSQVAEVASMLRDMAAKTALESANE